MDATSAGAANARRSLSQKAQRRKALEQVRSSTSWLPRAINHYGPSLIFLALLGIPVLFGLLATTQPMWLSVAVFAISVYLFLIVWGNVFSHVIKVMQDYPYVQRRTKSSMARKSWYRFACLTVLFANIAGVCGWIYLTFGSSFQSF